MANKNFEKIVSSQIDKALVEFERDRQAYLDKQTTLFFAQNYLGKYLPDIESIGIVYVGESYITVRVPLDFLQYQLTYNLLDKDGVEFRTRQYNTRREISWYHTDVLGKRRELEIYFEADHPEATCLLVKIDEKVETREVIIPVYEITCLDGAEEEIFQEKV